MRLYFLWLGFIIMVPILYGISTYLKYFKLEVSSTIPDHLVTGGAVCAVLSLIIVLILHSRNLKRIIKIERQKIIKGQTMIHYEVYQLGDKKATFTFKAKSGTLAIQLLENDDWVVTNEELEAIRDCLRQGFPDLEIIVISDQAKIVKVET